MLTSEEQDCLEMTVQLYKNILKIMGKGGSFHGDNVELVSHIHAIQNMILAQSAGREYPEKYRLLGQ